MKSYKEDSNTTRIAVLETIAFETKEALERLEKKIDTNHINLTNRLEKIDDNLTNRLEKIDNNLNNRIDNLNNRVEGLNQRLWSNFLWIMGTFIVFFGGTILTIIRTIPLHQ